MSSKTFNALVPLAVIILGGWIVRFTDLFLKGSFFDTVATLLIVATLFYFGIRLNPNKKRNDAWFKKMVISLVLVLIASIRLGYVLHPSLPDMLYWFALDGFAQSALIVYLGWQFFA